MRFLTVICYLCLMAFIVYVPSTFADIKIDNIESAKEESDNKLQSIPTVDILTINQDVIAVFELLKQENHYSAKIKLQQLIKANRSFNAAEQYLLLVAQAMIEDSGSSKKDQSIVVIKLLEQAKLLDDAISKQQLSQPEFSQLHLLLAQHHAKQQQFYLAYLEKKSYLKKYFLYRKNKRIRMIASLEQSFEVDDKKANNALLESQNKLKQQRVIEVQKEQQATQYNFSLLLVTAIVFGLLFFRQLKVCNKLTKLTKTDALTGLYNRSALFEHGKRIVASFTGQPTEFSILLLDLDQLKKINENFGHHVGDQVLIKVAELVKETMRYRDVFSRLGGAGFVALLPFADCNKAKAIALHINDKIAQYDFSSIMQQSKVTVSIGVATMEKDKLSFDDILHEADLAMYQAKEQGRNTFVCYQNIAVAKEKRGN